MRAWMRRVTGLSDSIGSTPVINCPESAVRETLLADATGLGSPGQSAAGHPGRTDRPHRAHPASAGRPQPNQSVTPTITLDALNAATAACPSANPSESTLSFVMMAVTVVDASSASETSAFTAPRVTFDTV